MEYLKLNMKMWVRSDALSETKQQLREVFTLFQKFWNLFQKVFKVVAQSHSSHPGTLLPEPTHAVVLIFEDRIISDPSYCSVDSVDVVFAGKIWSVYPNASPCMSLQCLNIPIRDAFLKLLPFFFPKYPVLSSHKNNWPTKCHQSLAYRMKFSFAF